MVDYGKLAFCSDLPGRKLAGPEATCSAPRNYDHLVHGIAEDDDIDRIGYCFRPNRDTVEHNEPY